MEIQILQVITMNLQCDHSYIKYTKQKDVVQYIWLHVCINLGSKFDIQNALKLIYKHHYFQIFLRGDTLTPR